MKRIAALSLTVVSIVLMSPPTHAFPWGELMDGVKETAEHAPRRIAGEAAGETAEHADDAVRGLPNEADALTGDTPIRMLENGAEEAGLDPEGAVKGAQQAPEEADNLQVPEAIAPVPLAVAGSSASDQGSGAALPIAGGTALAVTYGLYRVIKRKR